VGCGKDRSNRANHGVSFDEARKLLEGRDDHLVIYDAEHNATKIGSSPSVQSFGRMATRGERALFRRHLRGEKR